MGLDEAPIIPPAVVAEGASLPATVELLSWTLLASGAAPIEPVTAPVELAWPALADT